ncbi:MAG: YhbY family RNA-binding protein [Desulfurococcales archaeon]|nr:YhbY family RNA-binding protein [Desulfurococcales archaeon]
MQKKSKKVKEVIQGKAHVNIGKQGVTENVIKEIERRLEDEEVIKVRVLRSFKRASGREIEEIAEEVAGKVNAKVVDVRGNVFVLVKMRSRRR